MQGREQSGTPAPSPQLVHDLNQPLSAIFAYAQAGIQMIDHGGTDTALMRTLFGKIVTQCGRATAISQDLGKTMKTMPFEDPS